MAAHVYNMNAVMIWSKMANWGLSEGTKVQGRGCMQPEGNEAELEHCDAQHVRACPGVSVLKGFGASGGALRGA